MCGIIGFTSTKDTLNKDWIANARKTLFHRGPDASGEWISKCGRIVFQHQRLAIIDLFESSNQPFTIEHDNYSIVFNGEIYNYKEIKSELMNYGIQFSTNSDTEVLLQSYIYWGRDFLKHLNGMFAFAIYDKIKNIVFLARDRAGEKPLYYYYSSGTLYFASELKALLKIPSINKNINYNSLDCYLSMGYIPNKLCILEGFNKLPAAHSMIFDLKTGNLIIKDYWQIPPFDNTLKLSESSLLDELEFLLEDSVNKQLVSDVPLGVLLSGGIDSSLITAFAARSSRKLKTFTIRIPGNQSLDETEHARLIAKYFQTDHIELEAEEPSVDLLLTLAKSFDEPIADSSMIPMFLVSKLVREHCKVALGGDGGDELFGGYGHYPRLLWLQKYLGSIPLSLRKQISRMSEIMLPVGFKGRNWLSALKIDLEEGLPQISTFFDYETRMKLIPSLKNLNQNAEDIFLKNILQSSNLLERATRTDFKNYLAEDILVKVDRASMSNSLEVRAPMLDHRLVEFAFSKVPCSQKATVSNKKILLKKLTEKILPENFDRSRKQGFSIPLSQWLKNGRTRDFFNDVLTSNYCMFDKKTTTNLLKGLDNGRSNSERLFALMMMELWKNEYGISL